ncbi:hypothetical protein COV17_00485 [Candidatus Woesearchaeota archaeon CG10_big_fil_rev_8_21_14_0_10_36_11]|nr:MAG: hypothetical protein COV17_00485 [Candidatus Woesearchaeota archaeon CG10_big_fil_rev_8_21_14_0_10_36_11]
MKKEVVLVFIVFIITIFIAGCVDYKAYQIPEEQLTEDSLIDEIAQIEKELALEDETVVEEVILPELQEEPIAQEADTDLQVITVKENVFVKLDAIVTDPDKDPVTHTFSRPLNKKGEWQTQYGDAGEYIVTVAATDGRLTTSRRVKLVVERVNVAPIITGIIDMIVKEGELVTFEPTVKDPNNDHVTVTVSEPLKTGRFQTDHTSSGEYKIKVVASDGELETVKTVMIEVVDVNVLPVLEGIQDITVKEGETVEIKPIVSDIDGDDVTVTISEPVGNDGIWETTFTDHGEYVISIVADDGKEKVTKRINVVVGDVNMPPEIVDISLGTQ